MGINTMGRTLRLNRIHWKILNNTCLPSLTLSKFYILKILHTYVIVEGHKLAKKVIKIELSFPREFLVKTCFEYKNCASICVLPYFFNNSKNIWCAL